MSDPIPTPPTPEPTESTAPPAGNYRAVWVDGKMTYIATDPVPASTPAPSTQTETTVISRSGELTTVPPVPTPTPGTAPAPVVETDRLNATSDAPAEATPASTAVSPEPEPEPEPEPPEPTTAVHGEQQAAATALSVVPDLIRRREQAAADVAAGRGRPVSEFFAELDAESEPEPEPATTEPEPATESTEPATTEPESTTSPTLEDWLPHADAEVVVDQEIHHPDPEFSALRKKASKRLRVEHDIEAGRIKAMSVTDAESNTAPTAVSPESAPAQTTPVSPEPPEPTSKVRDEIRAFAAGESQIAPPPAPEPEPTLEPEQSSEPPRYVILPTHGVVDDGVSSFGPGPSPAPAPPTPPSVTVPDRDKAGASAEAQRSFQEEHPDASLDDLVKFTKNWPGTSGVAAPIGTEIPQPALSTSYTEVYESALAEFSPERIAAVAAADRPNAASDAATDLGPEPTAAVDVPLPKPSYNPQPSIDYWDATHAPAPAVETEPTVVSAEPEPAPASPSASLTAAVVAIGARIRPDLSPSELVDRAAPIAAELTELAATPDPIEPPTTESTAVAAEPEPAPAPHSPADTPLGPPVTTHIPSQTKPVSPTPPIIFDFTTGTVTGPTAPLASRPVPPPASLPAPTTADALEPVPAVTEALEPAPTDSSSLTQSSDELYQRALAEFTPERIALAVGFDIAVNRAVAAMATSVHATLAHPGTYTDCALCQAPNFTARRSESDHEALRAALASGLQARMELPLRDTLDQAIAENERYWSALNQLTPSTTSQALTDLAQPQPNQPEPTKAARAQADQAAVDQAVAAMASVYHAAQSHPGTLERCPLCTDPLNVEARHEALRAALGAGLQATLEAPLRTMLDEVLSENQLYYSTLNQLLAIAATAHSIGTSLTTEDH